MDLVERPRKKQLTYRRRHLALVPLDVVRLRYLETSIRDLFVDIENCFDYTLRRIKIDLLIRLMSIRRSILLMPAHLLRERLPVIRRRAVA
jgi:hypothetical protein